MIQRAFKLTTDFGTYLGRGVVTFPRGKCVGSPNLIFISPENGKIWLRFEYEVPFEWSQNWAPMMVPIGIVDLETCLLSRVKGKSIQFNRDALQYQFLWLYNKVKT